MMGDLNGVFGEVISSYSRKEAIEDGVLVDLNQFIPINESGYKFPIACTSAVWAIIEKAVNNKNHCNDYQGVILDLMYMGRATGRQVNETTKLYTVIITGAGRKKHHNFKIQCHGGDAAEPVLTIMLPEED